MNLVVSNDKYVIYLKKEEISDIDFSSKVQVESLFKTLFLKIKNRVNMELNGMFNIKVYLNNLFGAILVFEKEEEYYDYLINKIDMKIEIIEDSNILKEYEDINYIKDDTFYIYNDLYYTKYDNDIDSEFYKIIYGDIANEILDKSLVCHLKKV